MGVEGGARHPSQTAKISKIRNDLCLDEDQQGSIGGSRRETDGGTTADTGAADRRLRLGEIGCRNHEAGAAALGQSRQRHSGISPAQLVFGEKYELGAIRT